MANILTDERNKQYGRLTVLHQDPIRNKGHVEWMCRCVCGVEKYIRSSSLKSCITNSCGCFQKDTASTTHRKLLVKGSKYERWTVIDATPTYDVSGNNLQVLCKCDCGIEKLVKTSFLRNGMSKSCGCLRRDKLKELKYNEVGNKYGRLTVVGLFCRGKIHPTKHKYTYWTCICECGNQVEISGRSLRQGLTVSCGCYNKDLLKNAFCDETNHVYGLLTVIEKTDLQLDSRRGVVWRCICKCGNGALINGIDLRNGTTKSCGCLRTNLRTKTGEVGFHQLYRSYMSGAKQRDMVFELSEEEFFSLVQQNCYYCNDSPKRVSVGNRSNSKNSINNSKFLYNGIDRVDNNIGYISSNCVTCCTICNTAKMQMSLQDFIMHTQKLYYNLLERGLINADQ